MATTPNNEVPEDRDSFFGRAVSVAKTAAAHPRARDTFVPAVGIGALVLGSTSQVALALGAGLLAFALLDRRR
jgi:hypothetical protein